MAVLGDFQDDWDKMPGKEKFKTVMTAIAFLGGSMLAPILVKAIQKQLDVNEAVIGYSEGGIIGGLKFHILEREAVSYEADVTDHYIETNRPAHDHIAWRPVTITLQALQGRYFHDISEDAQKSLLYYRMFNAVSSFVPKIQGVSMARKVKSTISRFTGGSGIINNIANAITSWAFGILLDKIRTFTTNKLPLLFDEAGKIEDEQTKMFLDLETLFKLGLPVTVTTTWRTYDNMIITSLKPSRDGNGDITEFNVTLKQISIVSSIIVNKNNKLEGGNSTNQSAETTNKGSTSGTETKLPGPLKYDDTIPNIVEL